MFIEKNFFTWSNIIENDGRERSNLMFDQGFFQIFSRNFSISQTKKVTFCDVTYFVKVMLVDPPKEIWGFEPVFLLKVQLASHFLVFSVPFWSAASWNKIVPFYSQRFKCLPVTVEGQSSLSVHYLPQLLLLIINFYLQVALSLPSISY